MPGNGGEGRPARWGSSEARHPALVAIEHVVIGGLAADLDV
jgi:hypothetical protein